MTDLVQLTVRDFTASLASDSPAPGGGSASAATGAAGAALLGMVVRLTLGKEKYRAAWAELEPIAGRADSVRERLLELVDEDTRAFDAIVAARKLPKATDAEKLARGQAIDGATIVATSVPLQSATIAQEALALVPAALERGNQSAASDAFVAALLLDAAVGGALANVRINLPGIGDAELAKGFREDAESVAKRAAAAIEDVRVLARKKGLAL